MHICNHMCPSHLVLEMYGVRLGNGRIVWRQLDACLGSQSIGYVP